MYVEQGPTLLDEKPLRFVTLGRRSHSARARCGFPARSGVVILICLAAMSAWAFMALAALDL
jgi:hypothetical protein